LAGRTPPLRGIAVTAERAAAAESKTVLDSGLDMAQWLSRPAFGAEKRPAGNLSARLVNKVQKLVI
jgi:hypothetical protein